MEKSISLNIILFVLMLLFFSCEDMKDTYRQFTKDGEIIYISKADSIKTRGGEYRIGISWLVSDPKVTSYKIYWNSHRDSMVNTITKTAGIDTVRIMLNGMREDVHQFDIFMYDENGNSSVRASAIGRVYGDNYKASLLTRTYKLLTRKTSNAIFQWTEAAPTVLRVEVNYKNTLNAQILHFVPKEAIMDTLKNFPTGGTFQFRTAFLPEPAALDTFYTSFTSGLLN